MCTIDMVDTMELTPTVRRPPRRLYSKEFKLQLVNECTQPGASIAGVGLAHGINANLVHKWRRQAERGELFCASVPTFLPVTVAQAPPVAVSASTNKAEPDIRIELTAVRLTASVHWPITYAAQCATWLRQLLA